MTAQPPSGRGEIHDPRKEPPELGVGVAAEARVAVRRERGVDLGQGLNPRRHLPRRPGRYAPRFARYSDGASPVQRRNARVNALGCENPSEKVMSVIDRRGSSR